MYPNDRQYYPGNIDDIDRMMNELGAERQRMIQDGTQKPMDAKDQQLVTLAHEAGEMKAMYRGQKERCEKQLKTIENQSETINRLRSKEVECANWKTRAEEAETKLARRAKRKR